MSCHERTYIMYQVNRYGNNRPQQQEKNTRKASRFIENTGMVTKILSNGYLPIRHDSLPTPFASFEVETDAGKRYVLQVRGRQAMELDIKVGYRIDYDGRYIFPKEGKGGFFLASYVDVVSNQVDPYFTRLLAAKAFLAQQAIEGTEEVK